MVISYTKILTNFQRQVESSLLYTERSSNEIIADKGKSLSSTCDSCRFLTYSGGVDGKDDFDSVEKPGSIWPLAFLA